MELRFIPTPRGNGSASINGQGYSNQKSGLKVQSNSNHALTHRNELEYGLRRINHNDDLVINQKSTLVPPGNLSHGRSKIANTPTIMHGITSEYVHYNRSPILNRTSPAVKQQRHRLGSYNENMSSGSLNSIEV